MRESGKYSGMGLIAKLAWVALHALAGLSQVSSQGSIGTTSSPYFPSSVEFTPSFLNLAADTRFKTGRVNFGTDPVTFERIVNKLYLRIVQDDLDYRNDGVTGIASKLKGVVQDFIQKNCQDFNDLGKEWIMAEAVCAWVRTRVIANSEWLKPGVNRVPLENPEVVLAQNPPSATCGGFSNLVRDLGRAVGLKTFSVPGELRANGTPATGKNNHAWSCFLLQGDLLVPADVTVFRVTKLQVINARGKTGRAGILPKSPVEWELFLAAHWAMWPDGRDPNPGTEPIYKQTLTLMNTEFQRWASIDTSYHGFLTKTYDTWERKFNH